MAMAVSTLLFTGFEPFGGDVFNPSAALVRRFHGTPLTHGVRIHGLLLPVSGPAAWQKLSRSIRRLHPHWIVASGVSGRNELSLETMAWNEDDFRIPDNAGLQPMKSPILRRSPGSVRSPLATQLNPETFAGSSLPVRHSTDPGRFVCNHLYYRLLHLTRRPSHPAHQRAVFVHLPASPEMQQGSGDARFFFPLHDLAPLVLRVLNSVVERGLGSHPAALENPVT